MDGGAANRLLKQVWRQGVYDAGTINIKSENYCYRSEEKNIYHLALICFGFRLSGWTLIADLYLE